MFIANIYGIDESCNYYADIILVSGPTYDEAMKHVTDFYGEELLKVTMIGLTDNSEVCVLSDDMIFGFEEAENLFNKIDDSL